MNKADRIGIGYLYSPSSCVRYIEDALRTTCDVEYFGTSYRNRPGFSAEDSIVSLVDDNARDFVGFLLTEDCLFPGVINLECPTAIWFYDYWPGDYHRLRYARLFDLVFVSQRDWLDDFKSVGCKQVHWLPFACDLKFHRDLQLERNLDIGFVGNTNLAVQRERFETLTELSRRYKMNDFNQQFYLEDMARVYSQSKIVVNFPNRGGFNMRVFEAMACGAMLLTEDTGNGQKELFKPGVHLDVYRSKQELFSKVDYYLAHDSERQKIATAGKEEVRSKHRYTDRGQTIVEALKELKDKRHRSRNSDEILRAQTLFYARRTRVQPLLRYLIRSRCSMSTRAYIGARLLKTAINVVRA